MPKFTPNEEQLERRSSDGRWQVKQVTFSEADTDLIIRHNLPTPDPYQVNYKVLRSNAPCRVYHDGGASRRPWGAGFIVLRCDVAPVIVDLELTIAADGLGARALPVGAFTPGTDAATLGGNAPAFYRNVENVNAGTLALANGGTNASLSDPGADRILFWDDSGDTVDWLQVGTGLSLSGTTLSATATAIGELDDIPNVDAASPADGDVLTFDSVAGTWGPAAPGGGGGGGAIETDAYASRSAAGTDGTLFLPSDGVSIQRDNGSAWAPWGPIYPFTEPISGDFSWMALGVASQGGATITADKAVNYLYLPSGGGDWRIRRKAVPSAPYTATACLLIAASAGGGGYAGVNLTDNTNGDVVQFGLWFTNNGDPGRLSAIYRQFGGGTTTNKQWVRSGTLGPVLWLRINDDSTNRNFYWSVDGMHWLLFYSQGRTTHITPTHIGWGGQNGLDGDMGITLLSWDES